MTGIFNNYIVSSSLIPRPALNTDGHLVVTAIIWRPLHFDEAAQLILPIKEGDTHLKKIILATAITSASIVSGTTFAATDGSLGTTSSGTSLVTIIKDNAVQISNVNDLAFGTHSALATDITENDDVCVFSSTTGYNITVSSANGVMELQSATGTTPISYTMTWDTAPVTLGSAITGLTGDNSSPTCGGGVNANFAVTVSAADFNLADPETYEDTLTLLVQPE